MKSCSVARRTRRSGSTLKACPATTRAFASRMNATVEDLGSKNGTFVGGRRLHEAAALSDGDEIRLGSVVVTFRIPPPAKTTTTLRSGSRGGERV